jgi:hypothetical protein
MKVARESENDIGPVARYLIDDHERLGALLQRAVERAPEIDMAAYDAFRRGLLRHIGMEEKVLLPSAQRARGGVPLPAASRLRLDHGAIAALLVPVPNTAIVAALRGILAGHDGLEEGPGGVYEACEQLAGSASAALAAELQAFPDVPVSAPVEFSRVAAATCRALVRAGYDPASLGLADAIAGSRGECS